MCYEWEKIDYFLQNCRNESVMSRQQLNVILRKVFEIDNTEETDNKIEILKINWNNKYYVINSITKLQKIIDVALNKTKQINFKIEKFKTFINISFKLH